MALPVPGWWPGKRRRTSPFTRTVRGNLDITMPPPYDMSDDEQVRARQRVEEMVGRLSPGGIDAGTSGALDNLINAWLDQHAARLQAERDERQAVGEVLIGLAREELARQEPAYAADLDAVMQTREAMAVTFEALTGKPAASLQVVLPRRGDEIPLRSALGPVDLADSWHRPAEPAGRPQINGHPIHQRRATEPTAGDEPAPEPGRGVPS